MFSLFLSRYLSVLVLLTIHSVIWNAFLLFIKAQFIASPLIDCYICWLFAIFTFILIHKCNFFFSELISFHYFPINLFTHSIIHKYPCILFIWSSDWFNDPSTLPIQLLLETLDQKISDDRRKWRRFLLSSQCNILCHSMSRLKSVVWKFSI